MHTSIKYSIIFLFFSASNLLTAQVANYTFDNCDLSDSNGSFANAETIFSPSCDCGLSGDGMYFDGNNDHLLFPVELDSLMEEDFTISMYFRFDEIIGKTDILSVRSECALDSFLAITYNPATNNIALEMAQNIGNIQTEEAQLDQSVCWHRLVLTKSDLFYDVYLDDKLAISIFSNGVVNFTNKSRLAFTNSPCLAVNVNRFNGWIDEFQFYNRALSAIEINDNSLHPEMILTNDTTIVAGESVAIMSGPTCTDNFSWNPSVSLDDPSILTPIASPEETTTYTLTYNNATSNCITEDKITINVLDPDDINCEKLLLPNAFTPNNDQLNDTYGISTLFLIDNLSYFEIYDRSGSKIWSTTRKSDTWDGSTKGQKVNPGMYLYKVKYTCGNNDYLKIDNFSVLR